MCSNAAIRWSGQELTSDVPDALPGLDILSTDVRTVRTPEFAGVTFHEVMAKSALNRVPGSGGPLPYGWTINPYRGCSHACVYCFARPTHRYLNLDAGQDFDREIIVKTNIADVLRHELQRPRWARDPVALGTNTDPYQRAEGRYALMPGIIDALVDSRTPLSILTKGSLLRRDLDRLSAARATVAIDLAMSIAVYDDELQHSLEPGTPTTQARLATVTAIRDHGLDCAVFLMPILPHLNDSREHLDEALRRIKEAGATRVLYAPLHLKPGVKEWFAQWLKREHPELCDAYRTIYGSGTHASKEYRHRLAARIRPLIRDHGLYRDSEAPMTGGVRSSALRGRVPRAGAPWRNPVGFAPSSESPDLSSLTLF